MKEVWIVEQGEYSDYSVVGIFSTKENAQTIADLLNKNDSYVDASVSKRILDPLIKELREGYTPFAILMLRDGTVEKCEPKSREDISSYDMGEPGEIWRRSNAPAYRNKGVQDCLHGEYWGKDATHAIKIANEQRAQLIASGEWDRKDE